MYTQMAVIVTLVQSLWIAVVVEMQMISTDITLDGDDNVDDDVDGDDDDDDEKPAIRDHQEPQWLCSPKVQAPSPTDHVEIAFNKGFLNEDPDIWKPTL